MADEIRQRVESRLAELAPAIDEYRELMAIKEGLEGARGGDPAEPPPATRSPAKRSPAKRTARPTAAGSRARNRPSSGGPRQRGGGRAEQAMRIVGRKPGVTVNEIAAEMGINQNYLYRLLPRLEREGQLRREGKGWALAAT